MTDAAQTTTAGEAGASHPTASKYCSGCGALIHKDAAQCPKCGAPQADVRGRKNRAIAIVLALLLGGFGAHKFYLGRIGWGIVYFLFFWTIVPSVVAFVEAIIYVTMSDADFARKYG